MQEGERFACPDCGCHFTTGAKECPGCRVQFDWDDEVIPEDLEGTPDDMVDDQGFEWVEPPSSDGGDDDGRPAAAEVSEPVKEEVGEKIETRAQTDDGEDRAPEPDEEEASGETVPDPVVDEQTLSRFGLVFAVLCIVAFSATVLLTRWDTLLNGEAVESIGSRQLLMIYTSAVTTIVFALLTILDTMGIGRRPMAAGGA